MSDVLALFKQTGALLHGHFILRSGLHSREFFQCALLLQDAPVAAQVCGELAAKLRPFHDAAENVVNGRKPTVVSPAVGGIIVGQEVARHLGTRHIFVEKDGSGGLVMRRFEVVPGERFIVAEDVVTRGGRVQETIDIIRNLGGVVVAAGSIVDRSGGNLPDFGCPFVSLIQMTPETFPADALPEDLVGIPAVKPGSK
ncbi:MAG: orotate phosphoribosyltransferase [Chthoniobacterales bacterium]|jgi:orotate phosphoribosyltransferase